MNCRVISLVPLVSFLTITCTADTTTHIEATTACEAHAVMGQSATITCYFGRDIIATKHSFDVKFFPEDSDGPVPLLKCNWLVRKPDEPTCKAYYGCRLNSTFGNTLDVEIRNATKSNEGRYICQLVPSDGIEAQPCRLTVTDELTVQPAGQIVDSNSTVTPSPQTPEEGGTWVNIPAIVLGVITVVLVTGNLVLVVAYWRLRRRRQPKASQSEQEDNKSSSDTSSSAGLLEDTKDPPAS